MVYFKGHSGARTHVNYFSIDGEKWNFSVFLIGLRCIMNVFRSHEIFSNARKNHTIEVKFIRNHPSGGVLTLYVFCPEKTKYGLK